MTGSNHDGRPDWLDPTFLAGLANELFAEGRPPLAASTAGVEAKAAALADGEAGAAVRLDGLDYPGDPLSLDFVTDIPGPATVLPHHGGGEGFYFLQPAASPAPAPRAPGGAFPVEAVRQDFPILRQKVHGKPLVWLDNAATTQKPRQVIEALAHFYEHDNSNTRATHALAARVTARYEAARDRVRRFLGAAEPEEIVFTRGCTESINLVAQAYGRTHVRKGDEIVLSTLEHHANIVPWRQLADETGAVLRVAPVNDRGEVLLEEYEKLLGPRTRLLAVTHVSNALGTVLPVRAMTQLAHRHGARVLVDGAQSAPHLPVDVRALGCDFFVFASHKVYGPTGIGVLYGRRELLDEMPPWQGGGNMIDQVSFEQVTYKRAPARFEAGTTILAGAVGLAAALDYLDGLGPEAVRRHEDELLAHATEALAAVPGLRLVGTAAHRVGVLSFVLEGVDTEAMGRFLDHEGIAVRAGRHCAQPTMRRFGVTGTVRPSFALYNTHAEVDVLVEAVGKARAALA